LFSGGVHSNIKLKRAKSSGTKDRTILSLYNKLTELTALLAELVEIQELTDTIVLQVWSQYVMASCSYVQLRILVVCRCYGVGVL